MKRVSQCWVITHRTSPPANVFQILSLSPGPTSPLIDAGQHIDVIVDDINDVGRHQSLVTPPNGTAGAPTYPDIGAYESL